MDGGLSPWARHTSWQAHDRSPKSARRPSENSSIAFTTRRSQVPQLWAPRTRPPAVGWLFTWAFKSRVRSRTSTTDQSHGGRYSPRRKSRSTIVRLWTFTGLKETVSLYGSASCPDRTASSIASRSVRKGGLTSKYVFTVAPASRATVEARACSFRPHTLLTAYRRTFSFVDSSPKAISNSSTKRRAWSSWSRRNRWASVSTMTLSQRSPSSVRTRSRTSGDTSWSSKKFPEV